MAQPNLVVDFGAHTTAAALVVGERAALIRDPLSGATTWPSLLGLDAGIYLAGSAAERLQFTQPRSVIEGPRRCLDAERPVALAGTELPPTTALAAFLGAIRGEAVRVCTDRVERLTLTVPTGYAIGDRRPARAGRAGEAAGFRDVELLTEAAAAVLEAQATTVLADGSLVLVVDLGESWSTALVQLVGGEPRVIGSESSPAGRDLDGMLLDDLRTQARAWIEPILTASGDAALRGHHEVMGFLRRLKHEATTRDEVTGTLRDGMPPYRLTHEWLNRLAEPGLRWVVASARSLLARASAGQTGVVLPGSTMVDVSTVVLVGGAARIGNAARIIHEGLLRPMVTIGEPELAIARGGVRWVARAPTRRIVAEHPRWRVEPLSWAVPGGRARLVRWSVAEGEAFAAGAVLAQVRTPDERVFDLTAADEGTLLSHRARVGDIVGPTLSAISKRPASCLAGDPPGFRQHLSGDGEWLLLADQQVLVECEAQARRVRLWSVADGVPIGEFTPTLEGDRPHQGRVFVDPAGRLSLVAWDAAGQFSVWDVHARRRLASFKDPSAPSTVLVNEGEWRLTAEGEDATSAGRYRRSVATVWDLTTGRKLERLGDDWQRRLTGYGRRSAVDGFGERAFSPDGLLRAVSLRTPAGVSAITLQASAGDQEVFRTEQPSLRARTAFSGDGRFLLANWESDQRSQVDVWEL